MDYIAVSIEAARKGYTIQTEQEDGETVYTVTNGRKCYQCNDFDYLQMIVEAFLPEKRARR